MSPLNRNFFLGSFLLLGLSVSPSARDDADEDESTDDQIEVLIEHEKSEIEEWVDSAGDLPPVLLRGDEKTVLLFAPYLTRQSGDRLCTNFPFDEALDALDAGDAFEVTLDIANPRIRDIIGDACLVRPGDELSAIGAGWQQPAVLKNFVVRRERALCPNDEPFELRATLETVFPEAPLFFASDTETATSTVPFTGLSALGPIPVTPAMRNKLSERIRFLDEYSLAAYTVDASTPVKVVLVRKKEVSPEDADLPNELVAVEVGESFQILAQEKVQMRKRSGHVTIKGALDYNSDGWPDLVLTGDEAGCPYELIFKGGPWGYDRVPVPIKPCDC